MANAKKEKVTVVDVKNDRLLEIIKKRQEWKTLIEQAEAEVSELEEEIKQFMIEGGYKKIAVADHTVSISTFTRETVCKERVRQAVSAEVFKTLCEEKEQTRLTIK